MNQGRHIPWLTLLFTFLFAPSFPLTLSQPNFLETNELNPQAHGESEGDGRSLDLDILDSDYFDPEPQEVHEPKVLSKKVSCLGCPIEVDPQDAKILDLAQTAFTKLVSGEVEGQGLGDPDSVPLFLQLLKAQSQVVSGVKYILELEVGWANCSRERYSLTPQDCGLDEEKAHHTCILQILEKAWLKSLSLLHTQCTESPNDAKDTAGERSLAEVDDEEDEEEHVRKRRSVKNYGFPVSGTDSEVIELARFAIEQLDEMDEDDKSRVLIEVANANKQIVSGWLFHLKLRIAQTNCKEGTNASLETCGQDLETPLQKCEVKVLVQPWQLNPRKLVQSECYPDESKKSKKLSKSLKGKKIGGPTILDPKDKSLDELVNYAIESLDGMSNALHTTTPVRVLSAERQLASGIRTKVLVEVGYTGCRKKADLERSSCVLDHSRPLQLCDITVLEKPWLGQKQVLKYNCNPKDANGREKRAILLHRFEAFNVDEQSFQEFKELYGKEYESQEEHEYRFGVFKENMRKVKLLQDTEQGTAVYGATVFADLTEEEFSTRYLGLRVDLRQRMKRKQSKIPLLTNVPDEFDWRAYNAVTPVKNQGMCGSCWAFSVTGNIEGAYAIKHGTLFSFSEQELVDCDKLDEGCNGGLPENAYKAIEKLGGLETESEYPYNGHDRQCAFNSSFAKAKVRNFVEVSKNETEMAHWLFKNGPISIGINANAMQFYFGGVSHPWKFLCSPKNLDHGVLIVGYGVHTTSIRHKTLPYWIVKNSWGKSWGEQGYYRVFRGDGTCGVNQMATSAFVE